MTRGTRLLIVFDIALVLLFALFLWAPWTALVTDKGDAVTPSTLSWLALPVLLARHHVSLEFATITVTSCALAIAAIGAALAIAARMRGSAALWAAGAWLFGCSVAILMPALTAVGFLGALLLLLVLRFRFAATPSTSAVAAVLSELWPLGYAAGLAVLAWRYNPQLLLKVLIIALGVGLVGRAMVPGQSAGRAAASL